MWVEMDRVSPGAHDSTSTPYGKWLLERMKKGTLTAFIIEEDGHVLASGGVWIQDVQPRPGHPLTMWGYILSIYTEPSARRRGLARAIVDACIRHAKEVGCTRACLHASDEGRPLYEQLGFEKTAEMWMDLRPLEQRPSNRKGKRKGKGAKTAGRPRKPS
jgi:GNAT superfamily N-acetyltransferase